MNINLNENKSGHYKHIYFNIKLCENKSGYYCNLGNDWSHWTLTGFPNTVYMLCPHVTHLCVWEVHR